MDLGSSYKDGGKRNCMMLHSLMGYEKVKGFNG